MTLPSDCEHLTLNQEGGTLFVGFNRPNVRNALSLKMVSELETVLDALRLDRSIRVIVLRGEGGHFCAGGDVKDMSMARSANISEDGDAIATLNRRFGALCQKLNETLQVTIAVVEGAAMGGGFGLVCVCDVVLAHETAKFRLPETSLGLPPAQIAPFLVERLGRPTARRLALTGAKLSGITALDVGLVDAVFADEEDLLTQLSSLRSQILKCAPKASAETKSLLLPAGNESLDDLLDAGAAAFASAARGAEGMEGIIAFLQKKKASWVEDI